jgi:ATP-dependent Lhr-like helicase
VGELDEEMVFESRVGDTITLGSSSWLITTITADQVHVIPAPGAPGRLPFWKGDGLGRSAELGGAIGRFVREVGAAPAAAARERLRELGLDEWAADNVLAYIGDQRQAAGVVPDDVTIVVESFRDELGDWRIVVLSPWGYRVHLPWSMIIAARLERAYGLDIQAMATDDGIVFRLPDTAEGWDLDAPPAWAQDGLTGHLVVAPDEVEALVKAELAHSPHFAARFREAAARSLLLPRRAPGKRQPLWQLRNRSAQLLQVAARYPEFPVMLEAARECLHDDFDLAALTELMARVGRREVRVVEVTTPKASPFARTVLFNYVGVFMYEAVTPLAELRAAALAVDATLLTEVLGGGAGLDPADLLDPAVVDQVERELQCLTESRWARDSEDLHDLIRRLGPVTTAELRERTRLERRGQVEAWLEALAPVIAAQAATWEPRCAKEVGRSTSSPQPDSQVAGQARNDKESPTEGCDSQVAGQARHDDPTGARPDDAVRWVSVDQDLSPLALAARYARTHGPFTLEEVTAWAGCPVEEALAALVAEGRVVEGNLRPGSGEVTTYCDAQVLAQLRRRSLSKLRAEVQPVDQAAYARFLAQWQGIGDPRQRGLDGLRRAVDQLAGAAVPASMLETFVLPARVADYQPALLDELLATGEVAWLGRGELAGGDGWVTLVPGELVGVFAGDATSPVIAAQAATWEPRCAEEVGQSASSPPLDSQVAGQARNDNPPTARHDNPPTARHDDPPTDRGDVLAPAILDVLAPGGAFRLAEIAQAVGRAPSEVQEGLWRLAWAGLVTTDTLAPLRERLGGVRPTLRARPATPRTRTGRPRLGLARPAPRLGVTDTGGRWYALSTGGSGSPAADLVTQAEVLLDRHGVVTRGAVRTEGVPGGFAAVYRVLALAEDQGRVRRGYFVDRLGGSQFAAPGAVDRLRGTPAATGVTVLAAADPANPYGAALPWPDHSGGHQPGRKAGALVALVDGELRAFVERGARTVLTYGEGDVTVVAQALADLVHSGRVASLSVTVIDGEPVLARVTGPLATALGQAGFVLGPRGLRLRR